MKLEQLEAEARFVAAHAEHNLNLMLCNPEIVSEQYLQKNIERSIFMMDLHKSFQLQNKNARRPGRTLRLRTRLKLLVASILADERRKRKGEPA